ncbi:MAG: NACHT domain-containing protein [Eubacterium sp.]|nr:NACHT domain-containing protein [Eubacterium sp.]
MTPSNVPFLCGGIFFDLLLQARKPRRKARDKQKGGTDGLSAPDVMKGLVYVLTGDELKSAGDFSKSTSEYKTCKSNSNTYIPFEDTATVAAFIDSLKRKDFNLQLRMAEFLDKFIVPAKHEWLVKALIETLHEDVYINDDTSFSICQTESKSVEALLSADFVEIEIFLLSVFGYILQNRTDNSLGLDTFHTWFGRKSEHAEWKFNNDTLGSSITHEILIGRFQIDVDDDSTDPDMSRYAPIIFGSDGIVPDLANLNNGDIFLMDRYLLEDVNLGVFDDYLDKATKFYENIKTLLYSEKPRLFKDFYVCNNLQTKEFVGGPKTKLIVSSIETLSDISKQLIISGIGGIGKSMMMRHLFFDCADTYKDSGMLPILIPLNNYKETQTDLSEVLYNTICEFSDNVEQEDFDILLESGNFVILLDGLDEVVGNTRKVFQSALTNLIKKYPDNVIVISSRPNTSFIQMGHFQIVEILPFEKEQALELIDKLDFHDKVAKEKFRKDLDKKLYQSHKQFASNPLLLTIMLMTYSSYGEVPAKRHIFYAKAYETMARLHDASKGAYVRPMNTNLSPKVFAEYFSEFCARTYKSGIFEFTIETFSKHMDATIRRIGKHIEATSKNFLSDLTDNLCIMYKEGERYYFIHRSFQEYFCAVFFSTRMDDKLWKIGEFFETQSTRFNGDHTFDMLYDMIPERIDKYIFLPFLQELWNKCDKANGYWTYLEEMYSEIYAEEGQPGEFYENEPWSFLYSFIINEQLIRKNGELYNIDWPSSIDYCHREEWITVDIPYLIGDGRTITQSECMKYSEWVTYHKNIFAPDDEEPFIEGAIITIDVKEIQKRKDFFSDLIEFIEDDSFPLKQEYNRARKYTELLNDRINAKHDTDDWFDDF